MNQPHSSVSNDAPAQGSGPDDWIAKDLLATLAPLGWRGRLWISLLLLVAAWGVYAYLNQVVYGLGVTSMRDYVSWGLYISTFVFYIGISHVGALMSAILRMTGAEWRRPITRMAEAITFSSLFFGGMMPMLDMGRPDRLHHILLYGRLQSPVLWDVLCITTYFTGSTIFLFVPMIPDIAILRDRLTNVSAWRKRLYRFLALGYRGTHAQTERIEKCMAIMTAIILPIAISVHTVVSWIFGMTLRPGWNSTIFGPYFVSGALMSGCAAVLVAMAAFRWAYHLEKYITPLHFRRLALLVFALTMIYLYFNVCEYWTPSFKMAEGESHLLNDLFRGPYAPLYWTIQICGIGIPVVLLAIPRVRASIPAVVAISLMIVAAAWVKRYLIVVPTMLHPLLGIQQVPTKWSSYFPSWVEWSVTAGTFAGFMLVYTIVSRLFPIVPIWEVSEGVKHSGTQALGLDMGAAPVAAPERVRV